MYCLRCHSYVLCENIKIMKYIWNKKGRLCILNQSIIHIALQCWVFVFKLSPFIQLQKLSFYLLPHDMYNLGWCADKSVLRFILESTWGKEILLESIFIFFQLGKWKVKSITNKCKQENLLRKSLINFTAFLSIFLCLGDCSYILMGL